jgi:hypothetical protein
MSNKSTYVLSVATLAILALPGSAHTQAPQGVAANLAGTYRCQPEPSPCPWPTVSIAQTGNGLELKNDSGVVADGKVTSPITISGNPPWNAIGVVLPDHSIQWSNGTKWQKQ